MRDKIDSLRKELLPLINRHNHIKTTEVYLYWFDKYFQDVRRKLNIQAKEVKNKSTHFREYDIFESNKKVGVLRLRRKGIGKDMKPKIEFKGDINNE